TFFAISLHVALPISVVYASFGRGGGTGDYGNGVSYVDNGDDSMRGAYLPSNGQIDWDYIRNSYNAGIANGISEGYNGTMLRSSRSEEHTSELQSREK